MGNSTSKTTAKAAKAVTKNVEVTTTERTPAIEQIEVPDVAAQAIPTLFIPAGTTLELEATTWGGMIIRVMGSVFQTSKIELVSGNPSTNTTATSANVATRNAVANPPTWVAMKKPALKLPANVATRNAVANPPARVATMKPALKLPAKVAAKPPTKVATRKTVVKPPVKVTTRKAVVKPPVKVATRRAVIKPPVKVATRRAFANPPVKVATRRAFANPPVKVATRRAFANPPVKVATKKVAARPYPKQAVGLTFINNCNYNRKVCHLA